MLAQSSLAQGSKGCVQSDFLDKFFSLLWSMVILCAEMKKMKKMKKEKMKGKKRKKDIPSTNHLKNYIEYQV